MYACYRHSKICAWRIGTFTRALEAHKQIVLGGAITRACLGCTTAHSHVRTSDVFSFRTIDIEMGYVCWYTVTRASRFLGALESFGHKARHVPDELGASVVYSCCSIFRFVAAVYTVPIWRVGPACTIYLMASPGPCSPDCPALYPWRQTEVKVSFKKKNWSESFC